MAHVLNSSSPSVRICLTSRGNYRNEMHAPTFILMESQKVPQDSIGLLNMNRLMMNQPDLLYDEMELTIKRVRKSVGNVQAMNVQRYKISEMDEYEVFRRFLINKDSGNIETINASASLLINFILKILNQDYKNLKI